MAESEYDIRHSVSQLQVAHFRSYLLDRGWQEKPSRYVDHLYFEVARDDGAGLYEIYLPASPDVPKYRTRQMRAIYKLCGIEDREPNEIARDLLASEIATDRAASNASATRLRVVNAGSSPLHVRIDSPLREHEMLPGEAIELQCDVASSGCIEIERDDTSLTILAAGRK